MCKKDMSPACTLWDIHDGSANRRLAVRLKSQLLGRLNLKNKQTKAKTA